MNGTKESVGAEKIASEDVEYVMEDEFEGHITEHASDAELKDKEKDSIPDSIDFRERIHKL